MSLHTLTPHLQTHSWLAVHCTRLLAEGHAGHLASVLAGTGPTATEALKIPPAPHGKCYPLPPAPRGKTLPGP